MRLIVLVPARRGLAADKTTRQGVLARWWARSDRLPTAHGDSFTLLQNCFALPGSSIPVAALTRELDGYPADDAIWLRADPAHVRADMISARMLACGDLGLSREESDELLGELKLPFAEQGLRIEAGTPARWYVRCANEIDLPDFAPPEVALGDDLRKHLPEGHAGKRWRMLLNEAQIILHNHSLNASRVARGRPAVNSVWFWGAGRRPDWVRSAIAAAISEDPLVQALALGAGVPCSGMADRFDASGICNAAKAGSFLLDLRRLTGLDLEHGWLVPIDAALRSRRVRRVDVLFQSGERCQVNPRNGWFFWRAIRPLDT